jgi:hypothetical protein
MNALKGRWKDIANALGLKIIEIAKGVLEENVSIEMELSPFDDKTQRKMISACGDCRWDKRSSGRRYDSISGCTVMIGCRSQLVLDISPMSNTCAKCLKNLPHDPELCPRNVDCSAKAMEAIGSAEIVRDLFDRYDAYVHEYVGDDDSSTKKVLRHSWKEEMEAGLRDDVPRYETSRAKKPDNGLLPIEHPSITWLADKGHRVRQFANKIFMLCRKKKADCEGTPMDAERLKRNLSYAIRVNCTKGITEMKKAVESVLEHHFNNHGLCGLWCKVKNLSGEERTEAMLNYRSKEKNSVFYFQLKELFEEFMQLLEEMLHKWDTNIVEGMNKFFTKFLHKDRTYAMTIENKVRLYLAVAIDSVGYLEVYRRIGEETGLTICEINREMNLQLDNEKSYRRIYRKEDRNKIRRMRKFYEKLREGKRKLAEANRNNLRYDTGCSGPFAEDQQEIRDQNPAPTKKQKVTPSSAEKHCPRCGLLGHIRISSSQCLKNPKNMTGLLTTQNSEARAKGKSRTIRMRHVVVYVPKF